MHPCTPSQPLSDGAMRAGGNVVVQRATPTADGFWGKNHNLPQHPCSLDRRIKWHRSAHLAVWPPPCKPGNGTGHYRTVGQGRSTCTMTSSRSEKLAAQMKLVEKTHCELTRPTVCDTSPRGQPLCPVTGKPAYHATSRNMPWIALAVDLEEVTHLGDLFDSAAVDDVVRNRLWSIPDLQCAWEFPASSFPSRESNPP